MYRYFAIKCKSNKHYATLYESTKHAADDCSRHQLPFVRALWLVDHVVIEGIQTLIEENNL